MSEEQRVDLFDDASDARAEANRRAAETGEDHHVYGHTALFTGAFWYKVTQFYEGEERRVYSIKGVDALYEELMKDSFICESCGYLFDVDDSIKPQGKKGPMICVTCADKEESK